ncbi:MAG: hypothetical protein NTU44_02240, partial [Bacteroidetes bacterium]|nr:hypothetical protein [Bacteroidota bacterium]
MLLKISQISEVLTKKSAHLLAIMVICMGIFPSFSVKAATINCYPQQIDFWTGTVNSSGSKYQTSLVHAMGGGGDRGWMKFDISGIPTGSTINSVTLKYTVTSESFVYYYIRKLTSDPVTASGATIFSQCATGTNYLYVTSPNTGLNTRVLGYTVTTDLQNALASGWFAVGFYVPLSSSTYWLWADGCNQPNTKPYLSISYTTNFNYDIGVDSITSPPNQSCEGTWPVKVRFVNAAIQPLTSATINWSVNGVNQAVYNWTGTLAPGAFATITLANMLFTPGNTVIAVQTSSPNGQQDQFLNNNNKTNIVQIIPKPAIYQQPADQATAVGGNVTFSMVGSGGNITYQWQVSTDGGNIFNNLSATPPYSNVTTNSLVLTNCVQSMNGYKYRCVVSGTCLPDAITDTVILSVGPPIHAVAGTGYACPGGNTMVPVRVQNLIQCTGFKMYLNYTLPNVLYLNYSGVNPSLNGTFTVTSTPGQIVLEWIGTSSITMSDGLICDLSFSYNNNSPVVFDTVMPTVCYFTGPGGVTLPSHYTNGKVTTGIPSIITQPDDKLAVVNVPAYFRVVASGLPSYQWQISTDDAANWVNLNNTTVYQGVNTDTLKILIPSISMSGYRYRCILTGCGATVYTNQNTPPALNGALLSVIKLVKTWIDTVYTCPCATPNPSIAIPIHISNFDSVSTVSLHLIYKAAALSYDSAHINPILVNAGFSMYHNNLNYAGTSNNMFAFAFFTTFGVVSIPEGEPLYILYFKVLCDTTRLQWESGACSYSAGLMTFQSQFTNGITLNGGPLITTQPVSPPSVYTGDTATITTNAVTFTVPAGVTYQWEEWTSAAGWHNVTNGTTANGTYQGATTRILKITPLLVTMSGNQYRCKVFGLCAPV